MRGLPPLFLTYSSHTVTPSTLGPLRGHPGPFLATAQLTPAHMSLTRVQVHQLSSKVLWGRVPPCLSLPAHGAVSGGSNAPLSPNCDQQTCEDPVFPFHDSLCRWRGGYSEFLEGVSWELWGQGKAGHPHSNDKDHKRRLLRSQNRGRMVGLLSSEGSWSG